MLNQSMLIFVKKGWGNDEPTQSKTNLLSLFLLIDLEPDKYSGLPKSTHLY